MNKHRLSWTPSPNQWYQCKLVQDRYRIVFRGSGIYWVVSWYTGSNVCAGSLNECRRYVHKECYSHDEYVRRCY